MADFLDLNTISADTGFQGRCLYALTVAAVAVMTESNATVGHQTRNDFAIQVLNGNVDAQRIALIVLTNSTIAGEATTATLPGETAVPDGDIQFAVNSLYNVMAGLPSTTP